jgi:hypothetical protein
MKTNTMVPQPTIYGRYKYKHQILFDHNSTKMKNEFCMLDRFFHHIQVIYYICTEKLGEIKDNLFGF